MAQHYNHNLSFVSPSATPSCTPYNELASIYGNGQFYGTALGGPLINFEVVTQQPYDSRSTTPNNVQQNGNISRSSQEIESIVDAISNRFTENENNIKKEVLSVKSELTAGCRGQIGRIPRKSFDRIDKSRKL